MNGENHKELSKIIESCKCKPYLNGVDYCINCQNAVIDFMNKNGAGVLTNDIKIGNLTKEVAKLKINIESLQKKLNDKIKKYNKLKENEK